MAGMAYMKQPIAQQIVRNYQEDEDADLGSAYHAARSKATMLASIYASDIIVGIESMDTIAQAIVDRDSNEGLVPSMNQVSEFGRIRNNLQEKIASKTRKFT